MEEARPHPYDRRYYESSFGPIPYDRAHREWLNFFGQIADRVIRDMHPQRTLDVGCAKGFLVECLRDRGIEAYGVDVSEYAIGEVRPDIRPFCRVGSSVESIQERFDLITCIELVEHLDPRDGERTIANICAATDDVLFSSTPDDFAEPTHRNVQPSAYWEDLFSRAGFHRDPAYDAGFISRQAIRMRRD